MKNQITITALLILIFALATTAFADTKDFLSEMHGTYCSVHFILNLKETGSYTKARQMTVSEFNADRETYYDFIVVENRALTGYIGDDETKIEYFGLSISPDDTASIVCGFKKVYKKVSDETKLSYQQVEELLKAKYTY